MPVSIRLFLLLLFVALASGSGCAAPQTAQERLQSAVWELHEASAPLLRQMARDAGAAAAEQRQALGAAAGTDWLAEAQVIDSAAKEYSAAIEAKQWSRRLIPLLREALDSYIRLREAGLPLPPVPDLVLDLLKPCERG